MRGSSACLRVVLTAVAGLCAGCASSGYLANRGRDAADIATLTLGTGAGARLRAGPVHVAAIQSSDLVGLRCGRLLADGNALYYNRETYAPVPIRSIMPLLSRFWRTITGAAPSRWRRPPRPPGADQPTPPENPFTRDDVRGDSFRALFGSERFSYGVTAKSFADRRYVKAQAPAPIVVVGDTPSFYTQIEAEAGLLLTLRVGLNPGEALDFLAGWIGVDLFGDDRAGE